MQDDLITRLVAANPVPRGGSPHLPKPIRLLPSWRSAVGVAVAVAVLAGAGVAIAAGLGAFNGISAAQNKPTGAHVLPRPLRAMLKQLNATNAKIHAPDHLLLDTARVVGTMPDGSKVYGLTDTRGDLCRVGEVGGGCGPPLSHADPITAGSALPREGGTFIASGLAIDGVTSISFTLASGKKVTVPVKHNVWVYERKHADGVATNCFVAHFADGSSVVPAWPGKVRCP